MLLLAAGFALAGCASVDNVAPPVTPALLAHASGASANILQEGREIFFGVCTTCHAPDPIGSLTLADWRSAVADMADRSRLSPSRKAALLSYITAAKAAAPSSTL